MSESRPAAVGHLSAHSGRHSTAGSKSRVLMTRTVKLIHVAAGLLKHTKPRAAFNVNQPPFLASTTPHFSIDILNSRSTSPSPPRQLVAARTWMSPRQTALTT